MLYSTIAQVFALALLAVCILIAVRGDGWGRASVALHVVNYILIGVYQEHRSHRFPSVDFAIDSIGAAAAVAVAVISRRGWAAAVATFQLLGVLNYLPRLLDPSIHRQVFVASSYLWEAGALASLVWAAFRPGRGTV